MDAFQALDGELLKPEESESDRSIPVFNKDTKEVVDEVWDRLETTMEQTLSALTLQDLADIRTRKQTEIDYAI